MNAQDHTAAVIAAVAIGGLLLLGATGWLVGGATIAHILGAAGLATCL